MSAGRWPDHHVLIGVLGRLYVAGGQKDSLGPFYRDLWCLDLVKLDAWRALPGYPRQTAAFLNWKMVVHEDKAYLVTGRPKVDYFDLKTEKWGFITTTYKPTPEDRKAGIVENWPYPSQQLSDSAQQVTQGKLLVFGGMHGKTNIGCNLFMELDLETKVWRRLSGYVMPPPDNDYSCPGPRKSASSWVSRDTNRFYLLYGQCDRNGASLQGEPHGASDAFPFDDMWSWDLKTERWRRERRAGNTPSSRTEMACTYVRVPSYPWPLTHTITHSEFKARQSLHFWWLQPVSTNSLPPEEPTVRVFLLRGYFHVQPFRSSIAYGYGSLNRAVSEGCQSAQMETSAHSRVPDISLPSATRFGFCHWQDLSIWRLHQHRLRS